MWIGKRFISVNNGTIINFYRCNFNNLIINCRQSSGFNIKYNIRFFF